MEREDAEPRAVQRAGGARDQGGVGGETRLLPIRSRSRVDRRFFLKATSSFARCEPHVSTRGNDIHQSHTLLTDARIPSTDQTQAAAATALRLVRERKQNEEKRVGAEEGSVDGRREAYVATFDAAIEKAIDAALLRASTSSGSVAVED